MVRRSEGGRAGEGGKVLCGNVLGGAWMVTAGVGTRRWWTGRRRPGVVVDRCAVSDGRQGPAMVEHGVPGRPGSVMAASLSSNPAEVGSLIRWARRDEAMCGVRDGFAYSARG